MLGYAGNLPELIINANVLSKIALFSRIVKESFPYSRNVTKFGSTGLIFSFTVKGLISSRSFFL